MIEEIYSVVDIETNTVGKLPDGDKDELRYVGFKFNGRYACFHYTQREEIQKALDYFPYIVGHGFKNYDKKVLERYGFKFRRDQIIIDTYEIADNRMKSMMYIDLSVGDRSMDRLAVILKLDCRKMEYDYSKLKQDKFEGEDLKELQEYLYNDLDVTDSIFRYFYDMFVGFKEFMSDENKRKMCWLINKPGSTAYKCICNLTGLPEEYSDEQFEDNAYEGGFVSTPTCDFVEG